MSELVEYIQPVCPHCGLGVYRATINSSTNERYYCQIHGAIDGERVEFLRCEYHGNRVIMPGLFLSIETTAI